jgi:hypothetical protein
MTSYKFEVVERCGRRRRPYLREESRGALPEPAGHFKDPIWSEWLPLRSLHDVVVVVVVAGESKLAEYVLQDHEPEEQDQNDMLACTEPARDNKWGSHVKWGKWLEWLQATPGICQDQ